MMKEHHEDGSYYWEPDFDGLLLYSWQDSEFCDVGDPDECDNDYCEHSIFLVRLEVSDSSSARVMVSLIMRSIEYLSDREELP